MDLGQLRVCVIIAYKVVTSGFIWGVSAPKNNAIPFSDLQMGSVSGRFLFSVKNVSPCSFCRKMGAKE